MKSLFAMEGIDYVEPAAEPVEGVEPDVNFDTARIEENVLALDSAYAGIQSALESLDTLNQVKEAVGEGQELSPAALRIVRITVENIKTQLGVLQQEEVAMESVVDGKLSMEGLGAVISSVWNAIVRTFKWIWDTITSILGLNARVREQKLADERLKAIDTSLAIDAHTVRSGKVYDSYAYLGKPVSVQSLRANDEILSKASDETIKLFEAASETSIEIFKILNRVLEKLKDGDTEAVSKVIDELTQTGLEFIKTHANTFSKDSSIDVNDYRLGLPEHRYMTSAFRFATGLTRGRLIVLSAAYTDEDDRENVYPRLEIAQPRVPVVGTEVQVESMSGLAYKDLLDHVNKGVKDHDTRMVASSQKSRRNEKQNVYMLERSLRAFYDDIPPSATKILRIFSHLAQDLGGLRLSCLTVNIQINNSRLAAYEFCDRWNVKKK